MAKKSRPTSQKRNKEKARQERQREKGARRLEARERKAHAAPRLPGQDPDIAGIVPGPQPLPSEFGLPGPRDVAGAGADQPEDPSQAGPAGPGSKPA